MINLGKYNLLGINISAVDYDAAVSQIIEASRDGRPFGVSALAVHGVMTGVMDAQHRYRLNDLELVVPDGQPVRWGLNLIHKRNLRERVYGPELMLRTCQAAAREEIPVFLFGGHRELLDALQTKLTEKFPDLVIAGTRASQFRTISVPEKDAVIRQIVDSGARITFVGLGCPRQEVWAYEFKQHLQMPVLAVGAAFSFHAGKLRQAPQILQRYGLEWAFRLACEPRRLWRRYLFLNPYYLGMLACQWTGLRQFDPLDAEPPANEVRHG